MTFLLGVAAGFTLAALVVALLGYLGALDDADKEGYTS